MLRPATMDDADLLLRWRNDPLTRAMSIDQGEVKWADHIRWLQRRIDSLSAPWIYDVAGLPVGTVRLDDGELSWTVAPECRGRGFGTDMVAAACERFGSFTARIKPENSASLRIAAKCCIPVTLVQETVDA